MERDKDIIIRQPEPADAVRLNRLVKKLPPLAFNSVYCNLLQCTHFAGTSGLAEQGGELLAFVTAYRHPQKADTLFIWQIGVAAKCRGKKLPQKMIENILNRACCKEIHALEATVSSANEASRRMFESLARAEGANLHVDEAHYAPEIFGEEESFAEDLIRIAPLNKSRNAGEGGTAQQHS